MFYEFNDDTVSVSVECINKNVLTVGYIGINELQEIYKTLDFSLVAIEQCKQGFNVFSAGIVSFDNFRLIKIYTPEKTSIALFLKKNLMLIVNIDDKSSKIRDAFMNMLSLINSQALDETGLACIFLQEIVYNELKKIEELRKSINKLEEEILVKNQRDTINFELLEIKSKLLSFRSYYEQLADIGEMTGFNSFLAKANRLKENIDLLQGSVVHLWDCYQAGLDMKLNERMKTFTLLTTIFFPVTIIVGWYGMNFSFMPELKWKYGYLYVIILTVSVISVLIMIFKKKDWI